MDAGLAPRNADTLIPGSVDSALAMLLRGHSSDPLDEPLVRVIALVGQPDAGAQPQTARVLACNDGADDWSPFTLSDVRQERFEE